MSILSGMETCVFGHRSARIRTGNPTKPARADAGFNYKIDRTSRGIEMEHDGFSR